jgi:hypothetical protein
MRFGKSTITLGSLLILLMPIEVPRSRMHLPRSYWNLKPFDNRQGFTKMIGGRFPRLFC